MARLQSLGIWSTTILLNAPILFSIAVVLFGERAIQISGYSPAFELTRSLSLRPLCTTLCVASIATIASSASAMLVAYVAERTAMMQRWKDGYQLTYLMLYMIPPVAILPSAIWAVSSLRNQLPGVDVWYFPALLVAGLNAVFCWPYSLWLSARFMARVPPHLEEYAYTEGCGTVDVFIHAVWPQVRRPLVAVAIFAFAIAANDYVFAGTFMNEKGHRTVTVEVAALMGSEERAIRDIYFHALALHLGVELIAFYAIGSIEGEGGAT